MAASQCPKCGHLFEVRDGSGEPLPLAHCQSCDSYYPAHVESCKWCGTTLVPEKARKSGSDRLKWVAAGTFAVAVLLGFLARDPSPKAASRARVPDQSKAKAIARVDAVARAATAPPADTASAADTARGVGAIPPDVSTPLPAPAMPPSEGPAAVPQSVVAPAAVATAPAPALRSLPKSQGRERRTASPWVSMIAREWVTVRAGAERSSHIVASVGPNSRVQLGETRGSWRRIKSRGIAGWIDAKDGSFVAIRSSMHRTRRIAGR